VTFSTALGALSPEGACLPVATFFAASAFLPVDSG
jgi:hypothetical protein